MTAHQSEHGNLSERSRCNMTAYADWHSAQLENGEHLPLNELRIDLLQIARSNSEVWQVMDFDEGRDEFVDLYGGRRPKRLEITNGQAMEATTLFCRDTLTSLKSASAGGHGPPEDFLSEEYSGDFLFHVHDSMCSDYCLASDSLRAEAMAESQCDCLELSTDKDDLSYTKEGDFCLKNSGYLLCNSIDWNACDACELEDFQCPRRKFNKVEVPLRGYGNECNGGNILGQSTAILISLACLILFLL